MSRDLVHNVKQISALDAATIAATTNGLVVDTQGFESLTFLLNIGAFTFSGINNLTIKVQEGDQSDGSDMADIASGDYLDGYNEAGAIWDKLLNAAGEDGQAYRIGVRMSQKRYRRLVITEAGTVSVIMSATAVLGHPHHAPAGVAQVP